MSELSWAGGFFDGEGCTSLTRSRGKYVQIALAVKQVDRSNLERFHRAVNGRGRIYGPYNVKTGRPISSWSCFRNVDVTRVLALLWPHLGSAKRSQALDVRRRYLAKSHRTHFDRRVS